MIRFKHRLWVAAGLVAFVGSLSAAAPSNATDEAAIRAQSINWAKAYNGGDAAAVAAQYADDAVLLPPGAPGVSGRTAIQAFFTKSIADSHASGVVMNINPATDVGVAGNTGWESGTYTATIKGAVVESGKFLSVSRKVHGTWHYVRDTWNTDAPPAPSAPTEARK
ncbi:MAG: DUF4440 domain-containing protein [Dokdonella sp.]